MAILILATLRVVIEAVSVNCDPESVFIIWGLRYLAMASLEASTQKLASSVVDILRCRHLTFQRKSPIIFGRQVR
jgi:hypothetical protein